MKPILILTVYFLLSVSIVFVSCKKETSCEGCATKNNKPPIAVAGPDQVITLPNDSVLLDGSSSSDPDGKISEWLWTKISGPASFNIIRSTDSLTKVKALVVGTYLFELKVTDNGGLSAKDTMRIIVDPVLTTNHPPIANAGPDQTIILPTNSANLDGSASTDPENNITGYAWTKISGPSSFNIVNSNGVQTQVTNLIQGTYQFELKVTDAGGLFSKDTMLATVNAVQPDPCVAGRPIINAQLIPVGTLSITRYAMSIAYAGNKLLFAGGLDGSNYNSIGGIAFKQVDIYDVVTQNWSTAELSIERSQMGIAVAGNKIFFAGGWDSNDSWLQVLYKRIDIYDASTGSWTIDSLSWPRASPAGEVIANKVFFAGGWDFYFGTTNQAGVIDIKDLSTNTWSATPLSETKAYLSSEAIGNKIYFAGGAHGNDYTVASDRIDVYDNTTASWSTEVLLEPKAYFASIGFAGKIYWAGGATATPLTNPNAYMSSMVEIKDVTTNTSTQACLFQPNRLFSAVLKNDKIVFFTGEGTAKNKFDIYDVATNTWSIGVLPVDIYGVSIISVNNTIYVAGGYVNGVLSNQVWKLEF